MNKLTYPKIRKTEKRVEVVKEPAWNYVLNPKGSEKVDRGKGGRIAEHPYR